MRILLVVATELEIRPLIDKFCSNESNNDFSKQIKINEHNVDILVTGLGLVFSSYKLTKFLSLNAYDLVINAGIAGSFKPEIKIGDIVLVENEEFGDLGIESSDSFDTIFEKKFLNKNEFPFTNGKLKCEIPAILKYIDLMHVNSLSSNTAHGNQNTINWLVEKFNPDIETMEGAAFFYVCLMEKVNFIEIRAISNYVESRDTTKWNIPLAVDNLANQLINIINQI